MFFEVILCFYYWYFVGSWNDIEILHEKWILTYVMVLLVPINHRQRLLYFGISFVFRRRLEIC